MTNITRKMLYKKIVAEGLLSDRHQQVYNTIANYPNSTDREIMQLLGFKDANSVRPRRKELMDMGLIETVGKVKCKLSGRTVYAWCVVNNIKVSLVRYFKKNQFKLTCPLCSGQGKTTREATAIFISKHT